MAEFRLHCFAQSGNAYKAALMLELSGLDWEPVFVDYFHGETRTEQWRSDINDMGEVPVLEHGAERISQSGVILDYLADLTGRFAPADEVERRDVWRWILFDNHKFTSYFATLRFLIGLSGSPETPVTEFLRTRALGAYGVVEKRLAAHPYLAADRPTIADLSLAGYVFMPEPTGIDPAQFPAIEAWKARLSALPGWRHPYDLLPGAPADWRVKAAG